MLDTNKYPVLALNADFTPLEVMHWRDAIGVVMRDKAYVVENHEAFVRSPSTTLQIPSVIALNHYADSNRPAPFTRRNVFLAYALHDHVGTCWRCALCGEIERNTHELSFEHVIPVSRGGGTSWENIALAHVTCNGAKGNRTLAEAGLTLKVKLKAPSERDIILARIRTGFQEPPSTWMSFLERAYWNVPLLS